STCFDLSSLLNTCTYFIIPLISSESNNNNNVEIEMQAAYESFIQEAPYSPEANSKNSWKIDEKLMEELGKEEEYENCWEFIQKLGEDEGFVSFALSQLVL